MAAPYSGGAYFNRHDLWKNDIAKLNAADPATFRRGTVYQRNEDTLLTTGLRLLFGYHIPAYYACGKGQILLGEVDLSAVVGEHFPHLKRSRNFDAPYCAAFVRCFDSDARGDLQQRAIDLITATAPGTDLNRAARLYQRRVKEKDDVHLFLDCLKECHSPHAPVTAIQVGALVLVG